MPFGQFGNGFQNPPVGNQGVIERPAFESINYVPGVSGWAIFKNGNVEFNSGVFRGSLQAGSLTNTPIANSDFGGGTIHDSTIARTVITIDATGGQILVYSNTLASQTLNASGNINVPAGVNTLYRLQAWGWGAQGSSGFAGFGQANGGGGGGSGAYSEEDSVTVTPSTAYPVTMSQGNPTTGTFNGLLITANPGNSSPVGNNLFGGLGGAASANRIAFPGANGGNGNTSGSGFGGGGAGSAGTGGAGNNGKNATGSAPGGGGLAVTGGGHGGAGASGSGVSSAGSVPGAGSGGTGVGGTVGIAGTGQMTASWVTGTRLIGSISGETFTDTLGNSIPLAFMGNIVAINPTATPQVPETLHNLTPFAAGYSVGGSATYRMTAEGRLEINFRNLAHDGVTANPDGTVILTAANGLPAVYRPVSARRFPVYCNILRAGVSGAAIEVETDGSIQCYGQAQACTRVDGYATLPLDVT
jgi:hypothetical protein